MSTYRRIFCCLFSASLATSLICGISSWADDNVVKPKLQLGSTQFVHPRLSTMALSPDGKVLATAAHFDSSVILWDVQTGEQLKRIPSSNVKQLVFRSSEELLIADLFGYSSFNVESGKENWRETHKDGNLPPGSLHHDGKWLLSSPNKSQHPVFSIEGKKPLAETYPKTFAAPLAVSPDGNLVLTPGIKKFVALKGKRELAVFDLRAGKVIGSRPIEEKPKGKPDRRLSSFLKDSKTLLEVWSNGEAFLLDVPTLATKRKLRFDLGKTEDIFVNVILSPDETMLAFNWPDRKEVFEIQSGNRIFECQLPVFPNRETSGGPVCFSEDSRLLAVARLDMPIAIYDLKTGKDIGEKWGHRVALRHAAVSAKTKRVTTFGSDGSATIWGLDGKALRTIGLTGKAAGQGPVLRGISAGTNRIALELEPGWIHFWDVDREELVDDIILQNRARISTFCLSPDDEMLAVALEPKQLFDDLVVLIYMGRKKVKRFVVPFRSEYDRIDTLRLSPDGKRLAVAFSDQMYLWDVDAVRQIGPGFDEERPIAFSRDSKSFYYYLGWGGDRIWSGFGEVDAQTGKRLRSFGQEKQRNYHSYAISPDGKSMASATWEGQIDVWELNQGKKTHVLGGHRSQVHGLQFNTELGLLVSSGEDTTASVWDVKSLDLEVPDSRKSPFPDEVLMAWKEAGAQLDWMFVGEGGMLELRRTKKGQQGDVAAFALVANWKPGIFEKLPEPDRPIGFYLAHTGVADQNLKELQKFQHLRALSLGNSKVADNGLKVLGGLKELRLLDLTRTKVAGPGLRQLSALEHLHTLCLYGTKISDTGLKDVASLGQLKTLSLTYTGVTDRGLKELQELKRLETLWLAVTRVTGSGLQDLVGLQRLKSLYLYSANVDDEGLKGVGKLTQLQLLNLLNNSRVTDAGLKDLTNLKQLKRLELGGSVYFKKRKEVTDAGLRDLAKLDQLEYLGLGGTKVTDAGLKELAAFKKLHSISLFQTEVTDAGLRELAKLKQLKHIQLSLSKATREGVQALTRVIHGSPSLRRN